MTKHAIRMKAHHSPLHSIWLDPEALDKATIAPGVIGIEICPACGRVSLEVNRRFGASGCLMDHPTVDHIAYVAIRADQVGEHIPDEWKSRGGLVASPRMDSYPDPDA